LTPLDRIYLNGRFATQTLSGVQRFAAEVTQALQQINGESLTILVPPPGAPAYPQSRQTGRLHGQAWEQFDLPRAARDGFLVNLGNTAPLRSRRQLVVIHDAGVFSTPEAYSFKFRAWYKTMHSILVRRGIKIVTVSEFSRDEIIRHLRAAPSQVSVMPEGADHVARITAEPGILEKHGLTGTRFVLAVGTLSAHKNLAALGSLAKRLAAQDIALIIVGSLGGAAFQSDGKSALPQPARYIGRVTDGELKSLYQAAACFVFPSRYEGFGLPAVEAMATGCPVVAADILALRQSCGGAALYCDPAAPENIADRVLEVLDDDGLAARLRSAGLAHTQAMTWHRAAQALQEIIMAQQEVSK
jgi:glycosyltransferase involved in cell wall biosynthesis